MLLYISSHINSQSLSTLSVIEDFLSKRPMPSGIASSEPRSQNWVRNLNYYSESSSLCSVLLSPPLHLKKVQKSDGLLRYAVVPLHFICSPLLLCCPGIILNTISGLSQCSVRQVFLRNIQIFSYCRWCIVLYVSVNETLVFRTGWKHISLRKRTTYQSV